ncbi:MAG: glycosyltransferase family 2 protein [Candidatus Schmidhempelia sp.]|nr:glycosyltransferase family 2 protein [Candidatus Schmidhempelia sp.]
MNHSLISIIIPVYNTLDVIHRTLKSIEEQTYPYYEIVIVNDGSTDGSKEFLDEYVKLHQNVIVYHQINQGVSTARNKGLELANGKFVCFLDSDDTYAPNFLADMLKKQHQTNGNVILCDFNCIVNGQIIYRKTTFNDKSPCLTFLGNNGYFHFSGMLIEKAALLRTNIKFDPTLKFGEDILFTVQILSLLTCFHTNKILFNYYKREGSAVNSKWTKENWLNDIKSHKLVMAFLQNQNNKKLLVMAKKNIIQRELAYLLSCTKSLKRRERNDYIDNMDIVNSYQEINYLSLNKSDRKKFSLLTSKSFFMFILSYIYYVAIRKRIR